MKSVDCVLDCGHWNWSNLFKSPRGPWTYFLTINLAGWVCAPIWVLMWPGLKFFRHLTLPKRNSREWLGLVPEYFRVSMQSQKWSSMKSQVPLVNLDFCCEIISPSSSHWRKRQPLHPNVHVVEKNWLTNPGIFSQRYAFVSQVLERKTEGRSAGGWNLVQIVTVSNLVMVSHSDWSTEAFGLHVSEHCLEGKSKW